MIGVGFAVAMLSSLIPYSLELEALRRLPVGVFGVLMSLEPGVAALVGLIALSQGLAAAEAAGIALVMAAQRRRAQAACCRAAGGVGGPGGCGVERGPVAGGSASNPAGMCSRNWAWMHGRHEHSGNCQAGVRADLHSRRKLAGAPRQPAENGLFTHRLALLG